MRDVLIILLHLLTTIAKLIGPGGARAVVADSLLMKQQLLVMNRPRRPAPRLSALDRFLLGFWTLFLHPRRILESSVIIKPSTLLRFHQALIKRKYRWLYSFGKNGKPGPKGPSPELIQAIVEMKQRNLEYGCPRIAQQINKAFETYIDQDVVGRILTKHYRPGIDPDDGPSWLTLFGRTKDSLWSVDLFRCESILLKTHWVLVVMDQLTRRIVGFGVHADDVDGVALCWMLLNKAISQNELPYHLSSDNDPLFQFHRWKASLRILDVEEIKSVPYVPTSHPFVERLIRTVRREYLDQTLFWNPRDLEKKLTDFRDYYNHHRTHRSLGGATPAEVAGSGSKPKISLHSFQSQTYGSGLYQLPVAA